MRRFTHLTDDSSIYEEFPGRQTGLDEQLEVGKSKRGTHSVRSLVKFDLDELLNKIPDDVSLSDVRFDLQLVNSYTTKLRRDQPIAVHPVLDVSGSWSEGSGYFYQDIVESTDGVTWVSTSEGLQWDQPGGDFDDQVIAEVSASHPVPDWKIDITPIVNEWTSGSVTNNGVILKFPDADEQNSFNEGNVRVFSRNSHTVHVPVVVAKWVDSFHSSSLDMVPIDNILITPMNLRTSYKRNEVVRLNLRVRNRYPLKKFTNQFSNFTGTMALPEGSQFSIVDQTSGKVVIPFDQYSVVNTDDDGSWATFSTENMFVLRTYKILFKVMHGGQSIIIDDNRTFRIDR